MSDLIDRQMVLDAFGLSDETRKHSGDGSGYDTMMLYEIQDILEGLPSAEPEIEEKLGFLEFLWNVINPNEMEQYWSMYHCGGKEKIDG